MGNCISNKNKAFTIMDIDVATLNYRSFQGITQKVKIVDIYDGDTITICTKLTIKEPYALYKLRLSNIDAPEIKPKLNTPNRDSVVKAAKKVRNIMKNYLLNKIVYVTFEKEEKYGRLMGVVYYNSRCINSELICMGLCNKYDGKKKKIFSQDQLLNIISLDDDIMKLVKKQSQSMNIHQ